jgi:hypothetical protein
MHFNLNSALIATALAASIYLLFSKSDRLFPTIATVATGIELLLVMGVLSLSLAKYRIDVVLPALIILSGAVCWFRSTEKGAVTAATGLTLIGMIQVMLAIRA